VTVDADSFRLRAEFGSTQVKKGRHRRFEEARALKRSTEPRVEPCPECGAMPDDEHASWCLHDEVDEDNDGDDGDREDDHDAEDTGGAPAAG